MGRDIQLDGLEITIIKALGVSGPEVDGKTLMERCQNLDYAEVADTLKGLIAVGYAEGDSAAFHDREEFEKLKFRVNSGWSKELKEAINPEEKPTKSKRVRRE